MSGELVLIVEDNELNRKLLRDSLQFKGYGTLEAETGEEAMVLARNHHPALVLMDIQLPGISGIEALQQLRADKDMATVPVIAVTASAMEYDRAEIIGAGFDALHWKPINVKGILEEVRQLLDERSRS